MTQYIGGLDIGGTKMAAMVAGPDGPLLRLTQPTPKTGSDRALPEQAMSLLEAACQQAGVPFVSLNVIGVASCGPFVHRQGHIELVAPNICGGLAQAADLPNDWTSIPLEKVLRERFGQLVIENDCVAALSAERSFGAVQDEPNCVYVTWSTGIGFGLCVDGRILRGKQGNAGHAGHMLMSDTDDAVCGCGNRGDVEALCSGRNIGNRLHQPTADLFNAARQGEMLAAAEVQRAVQWFGRALYNLTVTLDVRTFVVGGSVWQHHGEWLTPLVMREIEGRLPALTVGVRIVPTALGELVADMGALSLAMPDDWLQRWRQTKPWEQLSEPGT